MSDKDRETLRRFLERHPHPPWLDGDKVEEYYR